MVSPSERAHPGAGRAGSRRRWLAAATGLVSLLLALAASEALLRAAGWEPWRRAELPGREPVMYDPDPVLGWRNRPGTYVYPGYSPGAPEVRVTNLPDGTRATGAPRDATGEVWLVGDSFMQGWGLSDEETLAWRLQASYPRLRFVNFGTGGYGTWQSWLRLQGALAERAPPELVVYGFISVHEERNVASAAWLREQARATRSHTVAVPFATLDHDGRLVGHPPLEHPRWWLRGRSSLVTFAQDLHARTRASGREAQARRVTQEILREMQAGSAARGARFVVLFFWIDGSAREDYAAFLGAHGIEWANCSRPVSLDLVIPGEGHPNGKLNALWARCVSRRIPLAEFAR